MKRPESDFDGESPCRWPLKAETRLANFAARHPGKEPGRQPGRQGADQAASQRGGTTYCAAAA
eukprot:12305809-Heterocapsa_arctica.AAC.1